jgi:hypothetical protein
LGAVFVPEWVRGSWKVVLMEAQEIFETVWNHFVVGGAPRSYDETRTNGTCLYRGPNGSKCAVGVLLTDNEYSLDMDGSIGGDTDVGSLARRGALPGRLMGHIPLLAALQAHHDDAMSDFDLRARLATFAANNDFGVHAP